MYAKGEALRGSAKLGVEEIEEMLGHLLRVPGMLERASVTLSPDLFGSLGEAHFRLLWETSLKLFGRNGKVTYVALMGELRKAEVDDSDLLTSKQWDALMRTESSRKRGPGLIAWMFKELQADDFDEDYGEDLLKRFLLERSVYDKIQSAFGREDEIPDNFQDLLYAAAKQQEQIESIGADVDVAPYSDNLVIKKLERHPLGVGWIDKHIGGLAAGEKMGIIGGYESGKTLLACQMAVDAATLFQIDNDIHGKPLKHVHLFHYEQPVEPAITSRVRSYAAKIPKSTLENMTDLADLSTAGQWRDYELKKFAKQIKIDPDFPGERERYKQNVSVLNRNLHLMDMSGGERKGGMGGVREVAGMLERGLKRNGELPGLIIIDYAMLMIRRYMRTKNIPNEQMRHYVAEVADEIGRLVCNRYEIPAIIFHQFTGEENKRLPGAPLSHANAAEAKNFAENLDICICLGNKDPETRVCQAAITKARRERASGHRTLLLVDGRFSRMVCVDKRYVVTKAKRIALRDSADQFVGAVPAMPSMSSRQRNAHSHVDEIG